MMGCAVATSPRKWTAARDEALLRMAGRGLPSARIAAAMLVTASAVNNRLARLRRAGAVWPDRRGASMRDGRIQQARRIWTPERDALILSLSATGLAHADIARRLGGSVTRAAVSLRLSRLRRGGRKAQVPHA